MKIFPCLIYSPRYDIRLLGFEKLHPFDGCKYSRAWKLLTDKFREKLKPHLVKPPRAASRRELLAVHTEAYLDRLRSSSYVAGALELPAARYFPSILIDRCVLSPMRWAVTGTIIAARYAMQSGLAVNMSGGYHHAKPDSGEGFCIYNDIALAVHDLRSSGWLSGGDTVAYIDLDAHQGNGVCHAFLNDRRVAIFDMYNRDIYPAFDRQARARIDRDLPLPRYCPGPEYLDKLRSNLPGFLDRLTEAGGLRLVVYNAGTDVLEGDPLGVLSLTEDEVLERDRFVFGQVLARKLPTVMLLSGGYSRQSHRLIANTVGYLLETLGTAAGCEPVMRQN